MTTENRHPEGLTTLFFVVLWERFAYYGVRALLFLYMIKSSLDLGDVRTYGIYATYTSMVYAAPVFGAMLMSWGLDARRGVIFGSLFMLAGMQMLTVPDLRVFYLALALIAVGSGFFKPAMAARAGELYRRLDGRRGPGYLLFYIGINLGAVLAPLVCGAIGELYGWSLGFSVAALAMFVSLVLYLGQAGTRSTIMAMATGLLIVLVPLFVQAEPWTGFLPHMTRMAAAIAFQAAVFLAWSGLGRGPSLGLAAEGDEAETRSPDETRDPDEGSDPPKPSWLPPLKLAALIAGGLLMTGLFWFALEGFTDLGEEGKALRFVSEERITELKEAEGFSAALKLATYELVALPMSCLLLVATIAGLLYMVVLAVTQGVAVRRGVVVVLLLSLASFVFWASFEFMGSSFSNLAEYNVDRVLAERTITEDDVGEVLKIEVTQAQLGYTYAGHEINIDDYERSKSGDLDGFGWLIKPEHVGMGVATRKDEIPAQEFQAINPMTIIFLGSILAALWFRFRSSRVFVGSFASVALSFLVFALGTAILWRALADSDQRGMISPLTFTFVYVLLSLAEILLSPVILTTISRLAAKRHAMVYFAFFFATSGLSSWLAKVAQYTYFHEESVQGFAMNHPMDLSEHVQKLLVPVTYASLAIAALAILAAIFLRRWSNPERWPTNTAEDRSN